MNFENTSTILSTIYDIHSATGKDDEWNIVLAKLRHLFSARFATLAKHQFSSGRGQGLYNSPNDENFNDTYNRKFSVRNPWFLSSTHYKEGLIFTGDDLLRNEDLVETDFYQHFLKPNELFHRLCGVLKRTQDVVFYIAFLRGSDQQAFCGQDKLLLQKIINHLTVSLHNHWRVLRADDMTDVLQAIINRFSCAAFVVDQEGTVLHRNNHSNDYVRKSELPELVDQSICAMTGIERRALLQAISEVVKVPYKKASEMERVVTISNPQSGQPILINIYPLGHIYSVEKTDDVSIVILTVRDPNKIYHPQSCSFSKLYELTPAQSRLSSLVFSGYSLPDAAIQLNVSENTLRSHLKQIYQKTQTHGQMELVHLHAKICTDHI